MTPSAAKWFGLLLVTLLLFGAVVPQTASAATCSGNCLVAGDYTIVSSGSGRVRTYLVHVPSSYAGAPVPLLLDLHGFSSNAFDERTYSGQLQQSEKRGFIAVWPQGEGFSWNGYGCCAVADLAHVDDVAFLRSVISEVKRRANIDSDRVYVTGISNGGGMAQRMACEAADVVRAVASVSFPLNYDRCAPSRPIGVTEIAGTADKTIPYDGSQPSSPLLPDDLLGVPLGVQGARQSLAAWKVIDGCSDELTRTPLPANSRIEEYRGCRGGVKVGLVTIADGPNVLYSGYIGLGYYGQYIPPIDIADYIWTDVFNF